MKSIRLQLFLALLMATGCTDPIIEHYGFIAGESLPDLPKRDPSEYRWPMRGNEYIVPKPPPLSCLTRYSGTLALSDYRSAELVPWPAENLHPRMLQFLDYAFQPVELKPKSILQLGPEECEGVHSFDVSPNGTRLIAIQGRQLALFDARSGRLIGRRDLPREIAALAQPVSAIRYCGGQSDFLLASPLQIFRISARTGEAIAKVDGFGESLRRWDVSRDGKHMLFVTESGRLFGGDTQLKHVRRYDTGNLSFETAALAPDGSHISVVIDGVPHAYEVTDYEISNLIRYARPQLRQQVSIASGLASDAWVDQESYFCIRRDERDPNVVDKQKITWNPVVASPAGLDPKTHHFLLVCNRRLASGTQPVLIDFDMVRREHSLPTLLSSIPLRIAHGNRTDRVALYDVKGLSIVQRDAVRTAGPELWRPAIQNWFDEERFAEIEKLIKIIRQQKRYGFGITPESLVTFVIDAVADRWAKVERLDSKDPRIERWAQFRRTATPLALTISGVHHYSMAWDIGADESLSPEERKEGYYGHLERAKKDLDAALESEQPPMAALRTRVYAGLQTNESIDSADPYCIRAIELYPNELDVYFAVAMMLLPEWHGNEGDALSFAHDVSRLYAGSDGDYVYMRIVARLIPQIPYRLSEVPWKTYDGVKIRNGVKEYIRRNPYLGQDIWVLWDQLKDRVNDVATANLIANHHAILHPMIWPAHYTWRYFRPGPNILLELHENAVDTGGTKPMTIPPPLPKT